MAKEKAVITLDRWFVLPAKGLPTVFFIDWTAPEPRVEWLTSCPPDCQTQYTVHPTAMGRTAITIAGRWPIESSGGLRSETRYSNIAFLKSHLQKCVRRQEATLALRTAYHMLCLEPGELFRRLPIILLEDTIGHVAIGVVVWLMCAYAEETRQSGAEPRASSVLRPVAVKAILGLVYGMCHLAYVDRHHPREIVGEMRHGTTGRGRFNLQRHFHDLQALPTAAQSFLLSLQMRLSYGGTDGDMTLLQDMIQLWWLRSQGTYERYITLLSAPLQTVPLELLDNPPPLALREWLLAGIDYHCAPYLIDWVRRKHPEYTVEQVRQAIWTGSSNINRRTPLMAGRLVATAAVLAEETPESLIWQRIQLTVQRSAAYILKQYH